jgi:hypothetical protein
MKRGTGMTIRDLHCGCGNMNLYMIKLYRLNPKLQNPKCSNANF